jgi:hypothetical protein
VDRRRVWLALGLLGAVGGGVAASSATGPDGAAQQPVDARLLLDLDILKETDLSRDREMLKRMQIIERMRILESMPAEETDPRKAPSEAKDR